MSLTGKRWICRWGLAKRATCSGPRIGISVSIVRFLIAVLFAHSSVGCASYRSVHHSADLRASERAVVLDLRVREGDIQRAVLGGALLGSELVIAERIPANSEGRIRLTNTNGAVVEGTRLNQGGSALAVAFPQRPMYLLAIRAASTHGIISTHLIHPLFIRIPPAKSECEYAGSLHVWFDGKELQVRLHDEFEKRREVIEGAIQGCRLERNLARQLTVDDLRRNGLYYDR